MLNWVILNCPHRKDKRNVGIANALYANIHQDWIGFFDAKSPRDFKNKDTLLESLVDDGFPEFFQNADIWKTKSPVTDIVDIWNMLRYVRVRAQNDDPTLDLLIKDDVYFTQIGHELLTEHFLLITREHLLKYCENWGIDLCYVVFSGKDIPRKFRTDAEGKPVEMTGYCFHPGVTPTVDLTAMFLSQRGAEVLLKRLLARVRNYAECQTTFRIYVFHNHEIPGGFSTTVKTTEKYPPDFLGDDIFPNETAYRGEFKRLFEGFRYYD